MEATASEAPERTPVDDRGEPVVKCPVCGGTVWEMAEALKTIMKGTGIPPGPLGFIFSLDLVNPNDRAAQITGMANRVTMIYDSCRQCGTMHRMGFNTELVRVR